MIFMVIQMEGERVVYMAAQYGDLGERDPLIVLIS